MSAEDEGRTEDATDKQRKKFRSEGTVPKSVEVNNFIQYLMGYVIFVFFGGMMVEDLMGMMRYAFTTLGTVDVTTDLQNVNITYFQGVMLLLAPLFAALAFSVLAVNLAQFGLVFSAKPIKPKFSKVNLFKNFKRVLLSMNSIMELAKSVAKLVVLTLLAWIAIQPLTDIFTSLNQLTPVQIGLVTWEFASDIWMYIILFMLTLAVIDASYQRHQHNERMKMTKDQVKDEHKQSQGDPTTKRRQRTKAMQFLQNMMLQNTASADVVITNPTHYAVALKYDHGSMSAPKVVAKGVDYLAMKIRRTAREHQIPIVENRGLARGLYYSSDIGQNIPETFFRPVAEILAFIFKLNRKKAAS